MIRSGDSAVEGTFGNIIRVEQYIEVDHYSCIPFTCICKTTRCRVLQFLSLFFCVGASKLVPAVGRMACGSNRANVERLDEGNFLLVESHYKSLGCYDGEISRKEQGNPYWIGVIDGCYRLELILLLMDTNSMWENIPWFLALSKSGFLA